MGAFDDLIPQNSPAQKPRSGAFDDLIPDQSAPAADAPASLGERFTVNMGEGFEGTLAGQAALNWMNEGNRYQAQADTVREVMRHMADNQMDVAPDTLPNPAQGGPSPEGPDYLGLGEPVQMPGRGTGDLAGMTLGDLESRLSMLESQAAKGQAEFDAERAPLLARREGMPAWHEEESLLGKAVAGATALGGQLVGGTPSPENLLAFGRGANVAERIARGAAGGAAGAGVAEPVVQEGQVRRGEREGTDAVEGALNVALGAALGGVLNVTPDMVRGVRSLLARRANKPESEVTEADVQAVDPQELLRLSQEASDARSMDPEALGEAITTATGARNDEPQLDPREAAKRRRQTERELDDAFTQTDVLRRDDVDVGEDGLSLRDEARPAQDPSGRQADPQTYGFLATAQRVAQENGLTLSPRDLDLAARDIAANDTADPLDVVRSYSQEGRQDAFGQADVRRRRGEDYARDRAGRIADFEAQPEQVQARIRREYAAQGINPDEVATTFTRAARSGELREVGDLRAEQAAESQREFSRPAFDVAERRRQRREQDLATGENVDNQASDYRAAANPAERADQRSVSLLDATRDRDGRLTGGESVQVLARSQRQTPDRGVEDMVRIKREGEQPEWVPATRVTDVETPANPRMAQQSAQETVEPPDGVGLERGDSPEGYTASQGSQPRRAVDRMSDPDGLRRGLYESADDQPDPRRPSDAPRGEEGQTVDGEVIRPRGPEPQRQVQGSRPGDQQRIEDPVSQAARRRADDTSQEYRVDPGRAPDAEAEFEARPDMDMDAYFDDAISTAQARERVPANSNAPDRLQEPGMASTLRETVQEFGWAERGGNLVRDSNGQAAGRTKWLATNPELMDAVKGKGITKDGYKKLVDRALDPEGRPLTDRQKGILEDVLDAVSPRDDMDDAPDFDLEAQTEDSLRADAERQRQAEDATQRQQRDEENRAAADREADDFVLTGSDRTADVAEARGQNDMFGAMPREPKPDPQAPGGGGSQLYSGLPVDRMWKSIKDLAGEEAESYRMSAEANAQLLDDAKSASGGLRAKNRGTKRNIMSDVWRVTLASLDGDMRVLAGKFNSPTLQSLPDEFHATAGKDSGTGQTFDEAAQARNSRLNEIDRLTEFLQNRKLTSPERQAQIIKMVENPRTPRRGDMGEAANRIEQYLKAELDYLRKAGVDVGEVRDGYFPREMDVGKAASQPDRFIAAATKAYRSTGLDEADAIASARAYWESTVFGASGKPGVRNQGSGTPSFVQGRVFDKAAAEHLRDFRVSDVDAVLGQYTMRATKRAEIARRFGDNWSRWDEIEQKILREDPDAQYVLPAMRDRVALSAGTQLDQMSAGARSTLSAMRTWTTLATLPKAAMASLGELVMAPLRGTTGSIPGDLGQATVNILGHLGNFTQTLTGMGRSEKMEAAFEMAEDLGIIAGTGHNSLMAARFAGGDPVGRVQSKVLASFFRRNLLEGLTNYTRVTSMRQGQVFLRRLSRQMERHPERAGYFLRELGVPKGREKDFANWLQGQQSDMPLASEVQGEFAPVYRNALQRFTDQTVMRPSNSTRPKWANHPLGAMVFQLQAFGYAFQKNVINRMGRTGAGLDKLDAAAFAASALPSVLLLVGAQGMFRYLRDELYSPDVNDRKTPAAFVEGAVSQAGLFGVADPYLQSLTGVRYQKPIWSAFTGPALGGLGDAADDLLAAGLNDSPNTNTAERNLADSVYDWAIEPAMQVALTAAPGGPVSGKLATAATVYGAPAGREPFTDATAGPEDPDKKNPPIQGTIEWLLGTQGGSGKSSGSSGGGSRWGGGSSSSRW